MGWLELALGLVIGVALGFAVAKFDVMPPELLGAGFMTLGIYFTWVAVAASVPTAHSVCSDSNGDLIPECHQEYAGNTEAADASNEWSNLMQLGGFGASAGTFAAGLITRRRRTNSSATTGDNAPGGPN
jgi:hypothetical protein